MAKTNKSIEPQVADLGNRWLKSYNLDYKLEQADLNEEIDNALLEYASKSGGKGGNRPDVKLLLSDENLNTYPILIEYKGKSDKLKMPHEGQTVHNLNDKGDILFKNIRDYAVNGAIHYANAILHYTNYKEIIAIGMTGSYDEQGKIKPKLGVYYVSKENLGLGQKIADYNDLSFLAPQNFNDFIRKVQNLKLTEDDRRKLKEKRENEINASLVKLNNDIFDEEKGLSEKHRLYLVCASIIATLGIPNKVQPLEKKELKSLPEKGNQDGDIILRKIKSFLNEKAIPSHKKDFMINEFTNILIQTSLNKIENGETQIKRVFSKIIDDLGIYYKINLTTDFTGKLFNEMYAWLGFSQDKLNDVVLTPAYVSTLLVKLCRVNQDSYLWDFATGSAGLLVAGMNEMLNDAKEKNVSPDILRKKELHIKTEQLLGIEILPDIYMLSILNMILMGDGSSNLINENSLTEFNGDYPNEKKKFPANAFVLNPPYSAEGKGMVFVKRALNMMHAGYGAVIIQSSAGSGAAIDFNKDILEKHTLTASIKMPVDLFAGKSSVQTCIYVFRVNEPHQKDEMVRFIDFSNDGYIRSARRKTSKKLIDKDRAKERYQEVVDLVRFGKSKRNILSQEDYVEDTINPQSGKDWNFDQHKKIDTKPTLVDFDRTIKDYLTWEMSQVIEQVV